MKTNYLLFLLLLLLLLLRVVVVATAVVATADVVVMLLFIHKLAVTNKLYQNHINLKCDKRLCVLPQVNNHIYKEKKKKKKKCLNEKIV